MTSFFSGLCAAVTAGSSSQLNMAADRSSQGFEQIEVIEVTSFGGMWMNDT